MDFSQVFLHFLLSSLAYQHILYRALWKPFVDRSLVICSRYVGFQSLLRQNYIDGAFGYCMINDIKWQCFCIASLKLRTIFINKEK